MRTRQHVSDDADHIGLDILLLLTTQRVLSQMIIFWSRYLLLPLHVRWHHTPSLVELVGMVVLGSKQDQLPQCQNCSR